MPRGVIGIKRIALFGPVGENLDKLAGDPSLTPAQKKLLNDLTEQTKQVTLNTAKGQVGDKLEILAEPNTANYAYQITWQLRGNRTVSTQRQTTASDIVYVDELPAH